MTEAFERERGALTAHAYRMLGDAARAEEVVQEAWIRWQPTLQQSTDLGPGSPGS